MNLDSIIRLLRIKLLVRNGLRLGKNVYIGENVSIDPHFCWLISIGNDCILGDRAVILAHDASTSIHLNNIKIGKVVIGNRTFIGANSVILPNVRIGDDVIIGAGSVVTHDIPNGFLASGNPARVIKPTSEYVKFHELNLKTHSVSHKTKQEILEMFDKQIVYLSSKGKMHPN
jgi:maltose O-acetyltransferase